MPDEKRESVKGIYWFPLKKYNEKGVNRMRESFSYLHILNFYVMLSTRKWNLTYLCIYYLIGETFHKLKILSKYPRRKQIKIQHYLTIENDFYNFLNIVSLLLNCGTYKRFTYTKAGFQRKIVYVKIKEK